MGEGAGRGRVKKEKAYPDREVISRVYNTKTVFGREFLPEFPLLQI